MVNGEDLAQTCGGSGPEQSIVTSAVWPVARSVVIPRHADELTMLKAYLDYYRETFELKCTGVDSALMSQRSSPPSTMSLHGSARHLAEYAQHDGHADLLREGIDGTVGA